VKYFEKFQSRFWNFYIWLHEHFSSSSSSSSLFAHKTLLKHARWAMREQDAQGTYCAPTEALNN